MYTEVHNRDQWYKAKTRRLMIRRFNSTRIARLLIIRYIVAIIKQVKTICTNFYINNMQIILIKHDVRLKIGLARPSISVVESWSVKPARGYSDRSFDADAGTDWLISASLCIYLSLWHALRARHKPIISMLLSDATYDNPCQIGSQVFAIEWRHCKKYKCCTWTYILKVANLKCQYMKNGES